MILFDNLYRVLKVTAFGKLPSSFISSAFSVKLPLDSTCAMRPNAGFGLMPFIGAFTSFDAFVYNQIWEDPRVDLQALQPDENSRILTISSGGCNALNYLIENPASITAIDLNRHHIFLLRLKAARVAVWNFSAAYQTE